MVHALPPRPPPETATSRSIPTVSFRHPAYPDFDSEFLLLSAVDGDDDGDGLDYDTAFYSCCIVTGNKWHGGEGWLAEKKGDRFDRTNRPDDGILRGKKYYFLLGDHGPKYKYPIHPSFDHWRFPHGDLPSLWSDLAIPQSQLEESLQGVFKQKAAAAARDVACRISGYHDACELAHLVPIADSNWFSSNDMKRYVRNPTELNPIDDEQNLVLLRRDLHYLFDQRRFTMTAKKTTPEDMSDTPTSQLVTHVLLPQNSREMVRLYQNRMPHLMTGISVELLFARFAWSIFTDNIVTFFRGVHEYSVLLFDTQTGCQRTRELYAPQIHKLPSLFGSSVRSRSVSPRKRNNNEVSEEDHGDALDGSLFYGSGAESGGSYSNVVDQFARGEWMEEGEDLRGAAVALAELRGRRRKRDWSPAIASTPSLSTSMLSADSPLLPDSQDSGFKGDQPNWHPEEEVTSDTKERPSKRLASMSN